jgi:hypothetical protein
MGEIGDFDDRHREPPERCWPRGGRSPHMLPRPGASGKSASAVPSGLLIEAGHLE